MLNISELLPLATTFLAERKIEKPRRLAEDLLAAALNMKRIDLYMQYDRLLVEAELEIMRGYLKRCATGEPIQQIIGEIEFYGCRIAINRDVLIPRQETEILVDLVVKKISQQPMKDKVIWDLCTGSGCIGLGIKRACPDLAVIMSDVSPKALALAQQNAERNQLIVELRLGDLLAPFKGQTADYIICNPPYVSFDEFAALSSSVRDYEPQIALLGGKTGLEFYQRLSVELPQYLSPNAQCFFEIGASQGPGVQEIFQGSPWRLVSLQQDWARHDRFIIISC